MSDPTSYDTCFNPTFHHGAVAMRDGYFYSYGGIQEAFAYNGFKNDYDNSASMYKLPSFDYYMYEYLVYNTSGNNTKDYNYAYTYPRMRELHTLTARKYIIYYHIFWHFNDTDLFIYLVPNTDTFLMYGGINGNNGKLILTACITFFTCTYEFLFIFYS